MKFAELQVFCWKTSLTMAALIWFLPSMSSWMLVKIILKWKSFLTLVALIWFLPTVSLHLNIKNNLPWKRFCTMRAFKWFLPSMSYHMFSKNTLLWKSFLTMGALIWFFPSVNSHLYCSLDIILNLITLSHFEWLLNPLYKLNIKYWQPSNVNYQQPLSEHQNGISANQIWYSLLYDHFE